MIRRRVAPPAFWSFVSLGHLAGPGFAGRSANWWSFPARKKKPAVWPWVKTQIG